MRQAPRDMQPSGLCRIDSSKTTDCPSPSVVSLSRFGGCLWKRQCCFGSESERARSGPTSVCQMFDQNVCRFLWRGVAKLNATSWLPIFEMRLALPTAESRQSKNSAARSTVDETEEDATRVNISRSLTVAEDFSINPLWTAHFYAQTSFPRGKIMRVAHIASHR